MKIRKARIFTSCEVCKFFKFMEFSGFSGFKNNIDVKICAECLDELEKDFQKGNQECTFDEYVDSIIILATMSKE